MNKPTIKSIEYWNYYECADYISKKYFEGKNLDDFTGKYITAQYDDSKEFQCFWHVILDKTELVNGAPFYLFFGDEYDGEDETKKWYYPILKKFEEEFGEDLS